MTDVIHLLSDAISNQIAAGEVIQRPASVVKELVENAIDAAATHIKIYIKDAGRSLIQVVDNGKGMSETDARMAFERHATSKIKVAQDLFSLRTLGFRGEALASIAAVAQVELRTCMENQELGTVINIAASQVERQEAIACNVGTVFSVRNLFFNIPARRKFLKSNEVEFRNILSEFERIVLVNPHISFLLIHNDLEISNLPVSNKAQRIINLCGKTLNQQLLPINVETSLINIGGYVGAPTSAKKRGAQQFFFVNGRYMRHPYFQKAISLAFEPFIHASESPNYFVYLDIDPTTIDVNIHPSKTEIKFENEKAIWQIIMAAVKESIAKSNAIPSIEFDREGAIDIPVYDSRQASQSFVPKVNLQKDYNPFRDSGTYKKPGMDWEVFFDKKETNQEDYTYNFELETEEIQGALFEKESKTFQYKGKYLIRPLKSSLLVVHQRRAHIRILFDEFIGRMERHKGVSHGMLFPEIISFTTKEANLLPYLLEDLAFIGFDLADLGGNSFSINGIPAGLEKIDPIESLQNMVAMALETGCEIKEEVEAALALSLAKQAAIPLGKILSDREINDIITHLLASSEMNYTPEGKKILFTIDDNEFEKRLP
ncbi:DNA mismatch repair protein MutL [Bacteroidales bacterium]|nr:DNA mismatch repair protein MutL [Bacteroidales bacterium]